MQALAPALQPPRNVPFIEMSSRKNPRIAHPPKTSAPALATTRLNELTRVIELSNYRSGTNRIGADHVQTGTEDGFDLGP